MGYKAEETMKPVVTLAVSLAVLAFAGSSSMALAVTPGQSKVSKSAQTTDVSNLEPLSLASGESYISDAATTFGSKTQSKIYQFNLKGKWGVKFDVNQPEARPSGANDIDAGAFYKLSPSLRVGGTLGFGEKTDPLQPSQLTQSKTDKTQPRVRLETTFKF